MRIIGYAFDAATCCPSCTRDAYDLGALTKIRGSYADMHGLPEMEDGEGNEVHPLFSTDGDAERETCNECGINLLAGDK